MQTINHFFKRQVQWFLSLTRGQQVFMVIALVCLVWRMTPALLKDDGSENLYNYLAQSFTQGRADVDIQIHDYIEFEGKTYFSGGPFPAVMLLPLVAIFGPAVNTTLVSVLLGVWGAATFARTLKRLDVPDENIFWLTWGAFLGTAFWLVVIWSDEYWFTAHVVTFVAMLLALDESFGKGRGWLVGIFLGAAFLSRPSMLYAGLFYLVALWENENHETRAEKLRAAGAFVAVYALAGVAYLAFNWLRFGDPLQTGHAFIHAAPRLQRRIDAYGLFNWRYVPFNFTYMFLQGFHIEIAEATDLTAGIRLDPFGTSLPAASPFLLAAFMARWKRSLSWVAWMSIAFTLGHMLFYHNNGWVEINAQRFTLDFLPILLVLVGLGSKRVQGNWWKAAIIYAVGLNILSLVILSKLPFHGVLP